VVDASGRRYLLKLDRRDWPNLSVGAEQVVSRLFWAAGYNVPASWALELRDDQLTGDPRLVAPLRAAAARTPSGLIRALAVTWIPGEILGGFDFKGTRRGDRNDRIPHQHRRSLRASYLLYAWTNYTDVSPANTVDSWVREGGRRFVRHYLVDFGSSLGSWTVEPKPVRVGHRDLLMTLVGRPPDRAWARAVERHPAIGALEGREWRVESFKPLHWNAAHAARTPADEYWGAKVVTSFTDAQIAAAVGAGGYRTRDAIRLMRVLAERRDVIGRRYLATATAVEDAVVDRGAVCFRDLAIERGYLSEVVYEVRWRDRGGRVLATGRALASGAKSCVAACLKGYRILELASGARPARIHLQDGRVVGLEHL
jgi:hypothetical protein